MTSSEPVLISPAELSELLASVQPPIIADVRWTLGGPPGKPDFCASHIQGAVWVDLETQLAGPPGVGGPVLAEPQRPSQSQKGKPP